MCTCVKMNIISFPSLWLSPLKLFLAQETEVNPPNHLYTSAFVAFGRLSNIVCYYSVEYQLAIFYWDGTKAEFSTTFMLNKVSGDCWNYSTCSETWLAQQLNSEEPSFQCVAWEKYLILVIDCINVTDSPHHFNLYLVINSWIKKKSSYPDTCQKFQKGIRGINYWYWIYWMLTKNRFHKPLILIIVFTTRTSKHPSG